MAQNVYLTAAGDIATLSDANVNVIAASGIQTVRLNAGATGANISPTVERIEFSGALSAYTFKATAGVGTQVFSGATLVATIPSVETAGVVLAFSNGSSTLLQTGGSAFTLGGAAVTTAAASAAIPTATVNAADVSTVSGPVVPSFTVESSAASVTEGSSTTFTVKLSAAQGLASTVAYTLAGTGGATLGTDTVAQPVTGTLTFAPGEVSKTIVVATVFDTLVETGEGVSLTLSAPSAGVVLGATAATTVAIADPVAPTFTLTSNAVAGAATTEGNTITYTITPSSVTDKAYTFTLTTQGDTIGGVASLASGADFSPAASTVTFAAGTSVAQTVVQTIVADGVIEGLEGYKTTLLNSALAVVGTPILGLVNDGSVTGTIGTTFLATVAIDNLVGTAADDTFVGDNEKLQAADVIVGGAGIDTLNYTNGSAVAAPIPAVTISGVEIISERNVSSGGVAETSTVTWAAVGAAGGTQTIGGVTITTAAIVGGETATNVALVAGGGVVAGTTITTASTAYTVAAAVGATNVFTSTTANQNVADLAATGTFTGAALAPTSVVTTQGRAGALDTINATTFAGATDFNSTLSTGNINFTGLVAGQKVGFTGNAAVVNGDLGVGYAATVTAGVINISGGTTRGTITETGAGITSNTINSTGAANTLTNVVLSGTNNVALTINATTNLTTGNITGFTGTTSTITVSGAAASVNLGTIEAATVKTITASGMTAGGVTATLNANTLINFTGGAGNDVVTLGAVLATGALVDAGAGTADRLVVTADAQITTATAPFIKGFEVVQANTGVTVDVSQLVAFNTITGIRVNDSSSGIVTVTGMNAVQAANVAIIAAANATGAITLGITGATTGGQIDTVNATLTTSTAAGAAQVSNLTGIVLAGVEKLTLTGANTVVSATGAVTLTTTAATSLDSIILTNAGNGNTITIAPGQTATNLNVDASASLGNTVIDASAYNTSTGATLRGGLGADVIQGSANGDSITGGAGNDVLSTSGIGGSTVGTDLAPGTITTSIAVSNISDTLNGGAGQDVYGVGLSTTAGLAAITTIVGLDLGTAVVAGAVDRIVVDLATPAAGAAGVVTITPTLQSSITASLTLAAAADLVLNALNAAANNVATFTYGADTYFAINGVMGGTTYVAGEDVIIKITGVVGTLDVTDITIL